MRAVAVDLKVVLVLRLLMTVKGTDQWRCPGVAPAGAVVPSLSAHGARWPDRRVTLEQQSGPGLPSGGCCHSRRPCHTLACPCPCLWGLRVCLGDCRAADAQGGAAGTPYPGVSVGPLEAVASKSPSREVEVTFSLGVLYQQQAAQTHSASGAAWSVVSGGDAAGASRHFFSRAPEVHPRRWCTRTTRLGRLCRGSRARARDAK